MRLNEFIDENVINFPSSAERAERQHRAGMSDQEKYDQAVTQQQQPHRDDVGVTACPHCGDVYCDYDCDGSQADMYNHPHFDGEVAHDMVKSDGTKSFNLGGHNPEREEVDVETLERLLRNAGIILPNDVKETNNAEALVGSGRADPAGKKTNPDSPAHRAVRTPDTTYSKTRKAYNNGAKPGANDGFVG